MSTTSTFRLLQKYGILVVDKDGRVKDLDRVPHANPGETYKGWKKRVFGDSAPEMQIFLPSQPTGQTLMSTLKERSQYQYIVDAMKEYRSLSTTDADVLAKEAEEQAKKARESVKQATKQAKEELERSKQLEGKLSKAELELLSISAIRKELVDDAVESLGGMLQPSLKELIDRIYENDSGDDIDTKQFIAKILNSFNRAVLHTKEQEKKIESLENEVKAKALALYKAEQREKGIYEV